MGNGIPPILHDYRNGKITWQQLEGIDYDLLGYFLSCHLIVEHYLNGYLKTSFPELRWNNARLSFGQKISLVSKEKFPDRYNCVPAIKHLNSLRNKISHNIDYIISLKDLDPLIKYIEKSTDGKAEIPSETNKIIELFTTLVCAWFAGYIASQVNHSKLTMDNGACD